MRYPPPLLLASGQTALRFAQGSTLRTLEGSKGYRPPPGPHNCKLKAGNEHVDKILAKLEKHDGNIEAMQKSIYRLLEHRSS